MKNRIFSRPRSFTTCLFDAPRSLATNSPQGVAFETPIKPDAKHPGDLNNEELNMLGLKPMDELPIKGDIGILCGPQGRPTSRIH